MDLNVSIFYLFRCRRLKKQFDDPITHFNEVAKQMTKNDVKEYTLKNLDTKVQDYSIFFCTVK